MIERMWSLVKMKDICVLATVAGEKPYCSLMAYVADDTCREIYLTTIRSSRKYSNIKENANVSLLVDTRETVPRWEAQALTVVGVCEEITDTEKQVVVREKLLKRHPHLVSILDLPDACIIRIKVESFLLLDGLTEAYFQLVT